MSITEPGQKMNFVESIYNWYRSVIRNPKYRWWIIAGTLVYLLSPIDIAPDFLPIIGWIDDGIIASLLVAELSQFLLERLKAGKGNTPDQGIYSANASATSNPDIVDVNAIKMD
ncbi:YkvA family protein [Leptothermofonsia sp. ETS-13]|uniref:YkvA family protein n=1 Tax=Leptothermofonsia sp. ETS-13 TaxID=3035696 RepID=UPI003BA3CC77